MRSLACLALIAVALPVAAHAQELRTLVLRGEAPPAAFRQEREPSVPLIAAQDWYGWQTLLVDLSSIALLFEGASRNDRTMTWLAYSIFPVGVPLVHAMHGALGKSAASLGLRVLLPLTAGYLGAAIGASSRGNCNSDSCGWGAAVGALGGLALGVLSAIIVDAVWANENPLEPKSAAVRDARWFFGGGGILVGDDGGVGGGVTLDAEYQAQHWGVRANAIGAALIQSYKSGTVANVSLLVDHVFGESETGPYVSAGLGYLRETGQSPTPTPIEVGQGAAAAAEVGALFWRDRTQGRAALGLRLTVPLFGDGTSGSGASPRNPSFPFLLLSLRFLI